MSGIPLFLLSFILVVCKSVISLIHIHLVRTSQSDSLHQEIVEVFKIIIVDQIIGFQPKPWHPILQVLQIVKVVKIVKLILILNIIIFSSTPFS